MSVGFFNAFSTFHTMPSVFGGGGGLPIDFEFLSKKEYGKEKNYKDDSTLPASLGRGLKT
jgi:hypothetical protein